MRAASIIAATPAALSVAPVEACVESKCAPRMTHLVGEVGAGQIAQQVEAVRPHLVVEPGPDVDLDGDRQALVEDPDHPVVVLDRDGRRGDDCARARGPRPAGSDEQRAAVRALGRPGPGRSPRGAPPTRDRSLPRSSTATTPSSTKERLHVVLQPRPAAAAARLPRSPVRGPCRFLQQAVVHPQHQLAVEQPDVARLLRQHDLAAQSPPMALQRRNATSRPPRTTSAVTVPSVPGRPGARIADDRHHLKARSDARGSVRATSPGRTRTAPRRRAAPTSACGPPAHSPAASMAGVPVTRGP